MENKGKSRLSGTLAAALISTSLVAQASAEGDRCAFAPMTVELEYGKRRIKVELPAKGSLVEESHYVTTEDDLPEIYPRPMTVQPKGERAVQCDEGIDAHIKRSFELYRKFKPDAKFEAVYYHWWEKAWTPQEGGECGQGSIGDLQLELLTPEMELWLLTMMWTEETRPPPGSRFLVSHRGKHIVAVAGFETGPDVRKFLGGVTPEIHDWLGTMNSTRNMRVAYLADQTLDPGPIDCD